MKSLSPVLLAFALAIIAPACMMKTERASMGAQGSLEFQPAPTAETAVAAGPRRNLTLVDFFAGY